MKRGYQFFVRITFQQARYVLLSIFNKLTGLADVEQRESGRFELHLLFKPTHALWIDMEQHYWSSEVECVDDCRTAR